MRTVFLTIGLVCSLSFGRAQAIKTRLQAAYNRLQNDSQMRYALTSLIVINNNTGKVVFATNNNVGLAPASSQKVITSITAFELLGKEYRYKTAVTYDGTISSGVLNGNIYVDGSGDPTLGSDRFSSTNAKIFLKKVTDALKQNNVQQVNGFIYIDQSKFSYQPTPGGWIWDDIGNYYGAGHYGINWRENQYDLVLKPGSSEGDDVSIIRTEPTLQSSSLTSLLTTGKKGSGDNAYIYLPPYSASGYVTGTVPAGSINFTISGAFPNPALQLQAELITALKTAGVVGNYQFKLLTQSGNAARSKAKKTELFTHYSPTLDSMTTWFLNKSINLYGEALIKTIAAEKNGFGETTLGLTTLFEFWNKLGIDSNAIRMMDGSGLSPQNRVTTQSFVTMLEYARGRPWFNFFYNALPLYNGIKMKSGTIGGTKSFTGYAKSKDGAAYTFAFIINNYTGKPAQIVSKMYRVLDELK